MQSLNCTFIKRKVKHPNTHTLGENLSQQRLHGNTNNQPQDHTAPGLRRRGRGLRLGARE